MAQENIERLKSDDKRIRILSAQRLGDVRSQGSVRALMQTAENDSEKDVRKAAIQSLVKISDPKAIPTLERIKDGDKDRGVKKEANNAIKDIRSSPKPVSDFSEADERRADFDERALEKGEKGQAGLGFKIKESISYRQSRDGKAIDEDDEEVEELVGSGAVHITNSGREDRIWAIEADLENVKGIEFSAEEESSMTFKDDKLTLSELEASETECLNFEFKVEKPKVTVEEDFVDAETGEGTPTFSRGVATEMKLILKVKNDYDFALSNVLVKKYLKENESQLSEFNGEIGSVKEDSDADGRFIVWEIPELEANTTTSSSCKLSIELGDDAEAYSVGDTVLTFKTIDQTISGLNLTTITGSSSVFQNISREEQEENPDNFECQFELENTSEFEMDLKLIKIFEGNVEDSNIRIEWLGDNFEEEERSIDPGETFTLDPWVTTVENEDEIPQFGREVDLSVKYLFDAVVETECIVPGYDLPFMDIKVSKEYSVEEVASYRRSPVETVTTVTSSGTTEIQYIKLEDLIPEGFEAPAADEIVVTKGDETLSSGNMSVDVSGSEEGDGQILTIEMPHLEDSEIGTLKQEEEIIAKYIITAVSPKPNTEYTSKVVAFANIYPEVKPVKAEAEDDLIIKVSHLRRKVKIGKMVRSTRSTGALNDYEIVLRGTNTGTAVLKNVVITDFIPKGFSLVSDTVEDPPVGKEEHSSVDGGSSLKWVYEEIEPEAKVEIKYTLRAEGEYDSKEVNRMLLG